MNSLEKEFHWRFEAELARINVLLAIILNNGRHLCITFVYYIKKLSHIEQLFRYHEKITKRIYCDLKYRWWSF